MVIGIRDFKNRAIELIRLVESGREEVTITRHSRPVARLVRTRKGRTEPEDHALVRLAAAGLIRLGDGKPFNKRWHPIKGSGRPASEIIIEDREDRIYLDWRPLCSAPRLRMSSLPLRTSV